MNFPDTPIRDVSELLDPNENLVLTAANNEELDFLGYAELMFKISHSSTPILVPFLVAKEDVPQPIIGTGVMKEVVEAEGSQEIVKVFEEALQDVKKKNVKGLVNLIQNHKKKMAKGRSCKYCNIFVINVFRNTVPFLQYLHGKRCLCPFANYI